MRSSRFLLLLAPVVAVATLAITATACVVPPPPPTGPPAGTVGYLGCSNTWMTVDGYHRGHGAGRVWRTLPFGGGSIDQWVEGSHYWADFDAELAAHPVSAVWWHVCMRPISGQADVERVLSELRRRIGPSVPVYATKMATYSDPSMCTMAAVSQSATIVDDLVTRDLVEPGPMLHEITPATTTDGCHPTTALADLDGDNLAAFFP